MEMIRKILRATPKDDYSVICEMDNGEVYLFDMSFVNNENGSMILPLRDLKFFKNVWIECGCLTWSNGFNTDGDTVVINGQLIKKSA